VATNVTVVRTKSITYFVCSWQSLILVLIEISPAITHRDCNVIFIYHDVLTIWCVSACLSVNSYRNQLHCFLFSSTHTDSLLQFLILSLLVPFFVILRVQNSNFTCCLAWMWNLVFIPREKHWLTMFQNTVQRLFEPLREEVTRRLRELHSERLHNSLFND
jgi:hypothetical protein